MNDMAQVDYLETKGEKPLVILPSKYVKPGFLISGGERQRLDDEELTIMNK